MGLARYLADRGHEVVVYCLESDGAAIDGVRVARLPSLKAPRALRLALAARAVPRDRHDVIEALGRAPGFDVYRAGGGVHAAWLQASVDGPLTWARARLSPMASIESRLDQRAAREARLVVCNAERPADEVRRWHGVESRRVVVVRNGVDAERFWPDSKARRQARSMWGARGRVALFLGSGFRRKGLDIAVRAFERASGPADKLVVAGRDAHAHRYLRAARRILGDRLVVLGPVLDPERWLPGADATILPTRYDPAANTTLEAMAAGVPPVVSGRDGNAEIVPDRSLVVADPSDVDGFAQALAYAWEASLGDACRQVATRWPISRNGCSMERIFRELGHG